jgi:hypothetical protein
MTKEEFKKQIEHPIDKIGIANVNNAKEAEWVFWKCLKKGGNKNENGDFRKSK